MKTYIVIKYRRRIAAALCLLALAWCLYLFCFKTLSNEEIVNYGWKGGGCGLPDVLDFRKSRKSTLRLDGNTLYAGSTRLGYIVKRDYRPLIEPYLEIESETGERCPFWGKWTN